MNKIKENLLPIGRNGEPGAGFIRRQGRRVRSTYLPERNSVMVRISRSYSAKTGKGPKWVHSTEGIPYLESLKRNAGVSDDTITCIRRLQTVWKLSFNKRKANGLFRVLKKDELWIVAYRKLSINKGAVTAGGGKGTIDGTSMKVLRRLKDLVSSGNYTVGVTRRVNIPKPKGGLRPLGIPEFQDKLVQEVLRTLLECVYEPRFYESSHGFRPQRSQHTCLRQIRRDFGGTKWVIEGDISKCFDTVNHHIVRRCLSRTIDDERFVNLIIRGLRSKVLMPKGALEWMDVGTPQGGVCSPLLSNIVLHQLDKFISRLKRRIDKGLRRRRNPEYVSLMNRSRYYRGMDAGKKAMRAARRITPVLTDDPNFRQLQYVRYADDFIIGVTGPRELAVRVKMLITRFLKQRLRLQLNDDKTVITQISKKGVPFLGYTIKKGPSFVMKHTQHFGNYTRRIRRIRSNGLILLADVNKVIQNLAYKGFCKGSEPVPNFRYMHQPQSYTITKVNNILRGLNEYYRVSENRKAAVSRFSYLIRYSIAKMFAAKYKLRTAAHVFKKAGKDLGSLLGSKGVSTHRADDNRSAKDAKNAGSVVKGKTLKLLYTKYKEISKPELSPLAKRWDPWKMVGQGHIPWPITRRTGFSIRGRMSLSASCSHCGSDKQVKMHHVRGLKHLNKNNIIEVAMIASKRKQVPLCRVCHLAAHGKKSRSK